MQALLRISIFLIVVSGLSPAAIAQPAKAAATEFVLRQNVGSNLKTLGLATARKTQTFAILVSGMGMLGAERLVSKELDYHAPQFQGQWNDNLAKAYAQSFTSEELKSLASEGRNSRYFGKLSEKQAVVGDSMQRMSATVLTAYVSAALYSAFSKMPAK